MNNFISQLIKGAKSLKLLKVGVLVLAFLLHGAWASDEKKITELDNDASNETQIVLDIKGDDPMMVDVQHLLVYVKKDSGDLVAIRYDVPARKKDGKNGILFTRDALESPEGAVLNTVYGKPTFRLTAGQLRDPDPAHQLQVTNAEPVVDRSTAHITSRDGGPIVLSYLYFGSKGSYIGLGSNLFNHLQLNILRDDKGGWKLSALDTPKDASSGITRDFSHMFCWKKDSGIAASVPIFDWQGWDKIPPPPSDATASNTNAASAASPDYSDASR